MKDRITNLDIFVDCLELVLVLILSIAVVVFSVLCLLTFMGVL